MSENELVEPVSEPDLNSDSDKVQDNLLETDVEGVDHIPEKSETHPVVKAQVKHMLANIEGQIFKFGDMLFKVTYTNNTSKKLNERIEDLNRQLQELEESLAILAQRP